MIFRIEDTRNSNGNHRDYKIPFNRCPKMMLSDLSGYISNEIRKEVNNSNDRSLLSYSKSLIVCLMKYNSFADNEIHMDINVDIDSYDFVYVYIKGKLKYISFDIKRGLYIDNYRHDCEITLCNFAIDISDNAQLNKYLKENTDTGKKVYASPEKDKEVLLFQSFNDIVIKEYINQVYLLMALALKFGMNKKVKKKICKKLWDLLSPDSKYIGVVQSEIMALIHITDYIYEKLFFEEQVLKTINETNDLRIYDPIYQFYSILDESKSFSDIYNEVSHYNIDIVSSIIIDTYSCYYLY